MAGHLAAPPSTDLAFSVDKLPISQVCPRKCPVLVDTRAINNTRQPGEGLASSVDEYKCLFCYAADRAAEILILRRVVTILECASVKVNAPVVSGIVRFILGALIRI